MWQVPQTTLSLTELNAPGAFCTFLIAVISIYITQQIAHSPEACSVQQVVKAQQVDSMN